MNPSPLLNPCANQNPQHLDGSSTRTSHTDKSPRPAPPRDAKGRFAPGNPGGPGNPFARQVAKLRSALVNRVTEADMVRIAEDLMVRARMGDLAAIKLLFQYVLGKPAETVNPDTLDIEEWQQTIGPIPQIMHELPAAMATMPVEKLSGMVRIMQPFVQEKCAELVANPPKTNAQEKPSPPDTQYDTPAPPSPNGGNGRKKPDRGPSPNGGNGQTKPLPAWLAEIAAKMPPSAKRGKEHRQGRKKQ
jgi:hypothetical protein